MKSSWMTFARRHTAALSGNTSNDSGRGRTRTRTGPRVLPTHDRLFTNRFGKPLTERGIISNMHRLDAGLSFRKLRPKAQTDGGDRNVTGHQGQMREVYTRARKLVPVRRWISRTSCSSFAIGWSSRFLRGWWERVGRKCLKLVGRVGIEPTTN